MCDPDRKLFIDSKDAPQELVKCYFKCVEERGELFIYQLFDQGGKFIIGDLHVGLKFNFALAGINWVLNITASSCEIVRGLWIIGRDGEPTGEPDMPYQAQAGGTLPADESSAAATA